MMINPRCILPVTFVLLGCSSPGFIGSKAPNGAPASASSLAAVAVNAHCDDVAKSRAEDAAANGYAHDMQKAVYDGTYADCIDWQKAHPGGD
jgi:hypothetical protein